MTEEILLVAWFFVVGATIGSFLNVVVYRMPKAMSLIVPSSHCPACKHRIRWFDNIPIVSWLVLGGRCRDCRAAISARYPVVESITACMFALLTAAEFTFKGINLPMREIYKAGSSSFSGWNDPKLYGILLYPLLLLCTLLAAALIEIDHNHPPRRLFVPALVIGVIAPLIWPYLRPVPAWPGFADWISRVLDCTAGLAAGGLLGYIAWRIQGTQSPGGMAWGLLCVGVFLGWQAASGVAFVILLLALLAAALGKRRKKAGAWPFSLWLYTVTLGWILAWSVIVDLIR
ncbi:MAG: prepilin peptidase [Thermoguttaceae bacterium]